MERERYKWKPHKADNTEAVSGGGLTRSSVEASVMEVERRGQAIRVFTY